MTHQNPQGIVLSYPEPLPRWCDLRHPLGAITKVACGFRRFLLSFLKAALCRPPWLVPPDPAHWSPRFWILIWFFQISKIDQRFPEIVFVELPFQATFVKVLPDVNFSCFICTIPFEVTFWSYLSCLLSYLLTSPFNPPV